MDQQNDLAQVHFIVHSVLIGTMEAEALIEALEIIDGIIGGEVSADSEAVAATEV